MPGIFAISDLHLPTHIQISKYDVPTDYFQRVFNYLEQHDPDILLIAGDLIWGSDFHLVQKEIALLRSLPGRLKFFIEGNHDLWVDHLGNSYKEAQKVMYRYFSTPEFYYIGGRASNISLNSIKVGICGVRGFSFDQNEKPTEKDLIRRKNELDALNQSLEQLKALISLQPTSMNMCMIHYPPSVSVFRMPRMEDNEFFNRIRDSGIINKIIFGHVHIDNDLQLYTKIGEIELYCATIDKNNYEAVKIFGEIGGKKRGHSF